jgi:methylated-DNA-[protein]-cysteine S-methyltransferase
MHYAVIDTPLGPLTLASTEKGLASVRFGNQIPQDGIVDVASNRKYIQQIDEYFAGRRTRFEFPLDLSGTPFQISVWQELLKIPYGETRSYGDIATGLGKPGASRAVGMANHDNQVAIVVPCHRVVGRDGSLTGYAGGVHLKRQLLSLETGQTRFET